MSYDKLQIALSPIKGMSLRCNNCDTRVEITLASLEVQDIKEVVCPCCRDRLSVDLLAQIANTYNLALGEVNSAESYGVVEYFSEG